MEIILVYSLLPLFFVILLVVVALLFLREKKALSKPVPFQRDDAAQESRNAYLFLGVFFVLLILLAVLKEYDYGRKDGA